MSDGWVYIKDVKEMATLVDQEQYKSIRIYNFKKPGWYWMRRYLGTNDDQVTRFDNAERRVMDLKDEILWLAQELNIARKKELDDQRSYSEESDI